MGKDQEFLEAARNGNISFIEKVLAQRAKRAGPLASLRRGPGVNVQDSSGYSALHHACLNGHIDIVRLLLAHEASTNLPDTRGSSPLHLAAWAGEQEIVKLLLVHPYRPANPNLQTIENETPLHCAAQHGHTGALALLLGHDADPNMRNSRGETPLDLAAQYGRIQAVQMLIRAHPELIAPFSTATIEGNQNSLKQHLNQQQQQQKHKSRHSSPLPHSGSVSTPSPSSPSAMSSPATPMRNIFPHTCLHLASRNGHKNVVDVLLAAGVCVNLLTPSGTALHEAALCGKENVVRTLLKAGIDLNATDAEGRTALDILKEFPPHVTKHIIAVINNFHNQMDTDDSEEVVYRQHHQSQSQTQYQQQKQQQQLYRNSNKRQQQQQQQQQQQPQQQQPHKQQQQKQQQQQQQKQYQQQQQQQQLQQQQQQQQLQQQQQQQYNNHHFNHFNSNNHLLNHSHSMQQASYEYCSVGGGNSKKQQRYASGAFNGGKSLDSGLQPDDICVVSVVGSGNSGGGGRYYHENINSPVHSHSNTSQNEMGISPSSSMSSFEPVSVSPRSRSSTGGIIGLNANPVHMSTFAPLNAPPKKPPRRNLSVSPTHTGQHFTYTSPNHKQQPNLQNNAARQCQQRSSSNDSPYSHQSHGSVGGISFDETQLRDRQRADRLYASARESTRSASGISMSSSNELLDERNSSSDQLNETFVPNNSNQENISNNSIKRPTPAPRNIGPISKEIINCENPILKSYNPNRKLKRNRNSCSITIGSVSSDSNNSDQKKQIPQSPTNYQQPPTPDHPPPSSKQAEHTIHERIRPLSQEYKRRSALIQANQFMIDNSTSPPKQLPMPMVTIPTYDCAYVPSPTTNTPLPTYHAAGMRGSSGSLSSSVSYSDQSVSTDCVEEFVGDIPFAGLLKGSTVNLRYDKLNVNAVNANKYKMPQRSASAPAAEVDPQKQRLPRPPIPTKPNLPERKPITSQQQQQQQQQKLQQPTLQEKSDDANNTNNANNSSMEKDSNSNSKENNNNNCNNNNNNNNNSNFSNSNNNNNEKQQKSPAKKCDDVVSHQSITTNSDEKHVSSNEDTSVAIPSPESSILSPFNAEEARKKISEIIESFGSGILDSNYTPNHDIELEFEDTEMPSERRELAIRLRNVGLLHLERIFFENGYDNYKFVNGVFEANDVELLHIPVADAVKLLRFIQTLPAVEFQQQVPLKTQQQEHKAKLTEDPEQKGVATLSQWLSSINLPEYVEYFSKHLYNSIDSVSGVWDVELQTVLEINKLGHRRRILQSLAYIRQVRDLKNGKIPLTENNETNKMLMKSNGTKEPAQPQTQQQQLQLQQPQLQQQQQQQQLQQHRSSITGYRKSRPAPQPPAKKSPQSKLQIRAPSELLLGLPANLRTKWRHSANALLNEQIKYEVYYLGSTVVKELHGTESTRKSIQKFKRDEQRTKSSLTNKYTENHQQQQQQYQQKQHKLSRNSSFNRQKRSLVCLAISHRGVEFIDVDNKRTICEHEIQNINCACQDAEDLRHFAYITKENEMHYCHVFNVDSTDLATEIILTLGQAFEVAYQLALRDGIATVPAALNNSLLQGEFETTDT